VGRVSLATIAAGLFTVALITVLSGAVTHLTIMATLGGLIALSLTHLILVNDRPPR
jgi:hypothetical protein